MIGIETADASDLVFIEVGGALPGEHLFRAIQGIAKITVSDHQITVTV